MDFFALFYKKTAIFFVVSEKSTTFAPAIEKNTMIARTEFFSIGVWCNGNTTDSGPVILGSSPSTPTS